MFFLNNILKTQELERDIGEMERDCQMRGTPISAHFGLSIKIEDFLKNKWKWQPSKLISAPGEVHKNWVVFPEKIKGK